MLLEALKEELFELEVERNQGKITPADYEKAKAALDQTLDRALSGKAKVVWGRAPSPVQAERSSAVARGQSLSRAQSTRPASNHSDKLR